MDEMTITLPELNNQLQNLSALVTKQAARIADLEGLETLVAKQAALIQHYEAQLLYLKRRQFGTSSERSILDSGQLSLFADLLDNVNVNAMPASPPTLETEEITYKRKKRKGKREEDLSSLPVVRVDYELHGDDCRCPSCDTIMRDIGVAIRREIEIIPAQAIIKEHAAHSYACPNLKCEGAKSDSLAIDVTGTSMAVPFKTRLQAALATSLVRSPLPTCFQPALNRNSYNGNSDAGDAYDIFDSNVDGKVHDTNTRGGNSGGSQIIIRANSPKPLISGSLASPSLVAHIAYQKYSNGMPLYRIEKGFQHDGVVISRQNMSNWVTSCSQMYLMSIYERLKHHLLQESVIHSDGTTIQVLREEGRAATTKSCEWVYRTSGASDKKIVLYEYTQTKGAEHPKKFLSDFTGYLHTDGAPNYHKLPHDITIVGCWAHARRYFENIIKSLAEDKRKDSEAATGLAYINALFKLERDFASLTSEERYLARLEKSKPIADAFFAWVQNLGALPQSLLGKAVHYALSQRKYLDNVFLDGRCELSNNRCERSIKPFVMGRKAWLFSNTPDGARASSVMYSIIETAKENNLHPFHYVKFLLEALPNSKTSDVEALLPWSRELPDWCRTTKTRT